MDANSEACKADRNRNVGRSLRARQLRRDGVTPLHSVSDNRDLRVPELREIACSGLLVIAMLLMGCQPDIAIEDSSVLVTQLHSNKITAVSYPLQYLTQTIAGDLIEVTCPLPVAADPDTWRPSPAQIAEMQQSDLIVINGTGAPYANWLNHVTLPESKVCQTANEGLRLSDLIVADGRQIVHSHGPDGEHSHPVMVSRTWLDPNLAKQQAAYIQKTLSKIYPQHAEIFDANLNQLNVQLDTLCEKLLVIQAKSQSQVSVVTLDNKLKFLTRAAGLKEHVFNHDDALQAEQFSEFLKRLLTNSDSQRLSAVLWSREPAPELRAAANELGLAQLSLDLLDHAPPSTDYIEAMHQNIAGLKTRTDVFPEKP